MRNPEKHITHNPPLLGSAVGLGLGLLLELNTSIEVAYSVMTGYMWSPMKVSVEMNATRRFISRCHEMRTLKTRHPQRGREIISLKIRWVGLNCEMC